MRPHVKRLRKEFQIRVKLGLITADDTCLKCHRPKDQVFQLELHHKIHLKDVEEGSDFDPNVPENVATLCTDCHKGYHVSYEEMEFNDWLENVSILEMYKKLDEYREEKRKSRAFHKNKHLRAAELKDNQ